MDLIDLEDLEFSFEAINDEAAILRAFALICALTGAEPDVEDIPSEGGNITWLNANPKASQS